MEARARRRSSDLEALGRRPRHTARRGRGWALQDRQASALRRCAISVTSRGLAYAAGLETVGSRLGRGSTCLILSTAILLMAVPSSSSKEGAARAVTEQELRVAYQGPSAL